MALDGFTIGTTPAASGGNSGALNGFTIGGSAPAAAAVPASLPSPSIAPPKPVDTSSLFSKFTGFLGNALKPVSNYAAKNVSKINTMPNLSDELANTDFIKDVANNPEKSAGENILNTTASLVGGSSPENLPLGVGDVIKSSKEFLNNTQTPDLTFDDWLTGVKTGAQNFVKQPISGATELPNIVTAGKYQPQIKFTIPGLGEVTNSDYNIAQRVANGEDPNVVVPEEKASGFLNVLFLAGLISGVVTPRATTVFKTTLPKDLGIKPKTPLQSFKVYPGDPIATQTITPELTAKLAREKGINLSVIKGYNPELPSYFKMTGSTANNISVEIVQLKPSYLDSLFGKSNTPKSVPELLGAPSETPSPQEILPAVQKAGVKDIVPIYSKTIDIAKVGSLINEAPKLPSQENQKTTTPPPAEPPSMAHTVTHNALRLLKAPTDTAKDGGAVLQKEIKQSIAEHGEDVTHQALTEKIGVDAITASRLIQEAKVPQTAAEIQAVHEKIIGKINPAQPTKLSNEEAAPLAHIAAERYQKEVIKKGEATVIGADNLKDHFGKDYNDNNHPIYSQAATKLYTRALTENTDPGVVFTGGGPGSGKSELLVNHAKEAGFKGIIYDSNFSNYEGAVRQIEAARAAGKHIRIMGMLPNLEKARGFTIKRENETGRAITDHTFAHGHTNFPEVVRQLLENGIVKPEEVHLFDTREVDTKRKIEEMVKNGGRVSDPLATVKNLGYTKDNLKETYAKENYDKEGNFLRGAGQELPGGELQKEADHTSAHDRADKVGGFVNPEKVLEDVSAKVKEVQQTIEDIQKVRELTGTAVDATYQHENMRKATRVRLTQLLEKVGDMLDVQGWEKLYHYDENKEEPVSEEEQKIYDTVIVPLKELLTSVIKDYREAGGIVTPDLFFMSQDEYTPRFAQEKGSAIDKLIESAKKVQKSIANGGLLSKSLGTVSKSRKFHIAIDENGKRTVVYVPTNKAENVTAFKNGTLSDLGPVKGTKTPKVKEFFDPEVRNKLERLAKDLGITHERVPMGKSRGLGPKTAGVSFKDESLIKTRLSPDSVLAHEIGHQIDHKFGMQAFMNEERYDAQRKREVQQEMRDLADTRFGGDHVTPSFKNYVRKGTEKMAVMFEAYISNKEMFKEVAPHLYSDFSDFLYEHKELRPFADIEGSTKLSSATYGGEQSGKIGKTFVDAAGNKYTLGQATTKEIEANTKTRYHKNVIANYVVALDRAQNALNAMRLLERLQNEKEFGEIIKKDDPDEAPPTDWQTVGDVLPQFRGYHIEPRMAEALRDLAGRQRGMMHIPVFDEINNLLVKAIVLNPIMHGPNELMGYTADIAATGLSKNSYSNLKRAYKEVRESGPLFLSYLEHGAPFMSLKETTKNFSDAILTQYNAELEQNPEKNFDLAKALGFKTVASYAEKLDNINHTATWVTNDILFMHRLLDYAESRNITPEAAIKEVSKRMADYRIPARILLPGQAGRVLSVAAQTRAFMFMRYHYSGVIKPWIENIKDSVNPGASTAQRIAGLRTMAYIALMGLIMYPLLDKFWRGITGSDTSYQTMAGPVRPIQVGEKLAGAGVGGIPTALQSLFTPSPAVRSAIELGFNVDLFNHNPIYGLPPAEGMTAYGTSIVSPLASASRMNPKDFALALFGIWTPKNQATKNQLNSMKNDEKPALLTQIKKDILQGNQAKADATMAEFNNRAIATWNQYQLSIGGKPLAADGSENQAFLKEWGIKEPGGKAMANAAALYGDGALTSKSSLIDTVSTYAKAIGSDPLGAFDRIFTGQRIVRVYQAGIFSPHATIIVERMPLASSEAIRKEDAAAQGLTDEAMKGLQLDHFVPLEAGGTNSKDNLDLVTTNQNESLHSYVETPVTAALKAGTITHEQALEYIVRYKIGTLGEIPNQRYLDMYKNKYGSKPMSADEVVQAINKS